jgi:thiol-disulfide isomerase/thioredoxin
MYNILKIITLLVLPYGGAEALFADFNTNPNNTVKFYGGSFENAKSKANEEGKLFFVEFYADWCTPCKWMDKTTFQNEEVVTLLNENYVPLKMDIESNEGTNLKAQYEIRMLPTILIFNSQGRMVDRVEKTMSSETMTSLLNYHNNPSNRVSAYVVPNSSPNSVPNASGPNLDHLYGQYKMAEKFRTNYKLQVGNHMNYKSAFEQVKGLKDQFIEPIVVMNDYVNNKTQYKVLLGEFKTITEAESFRKILTRDFDIDAIVY